MASTIKVDKIEGSTGSTVTVPTGQTFTVTDGIAIGNLPTITAVKGGTGQTSFAAGDILYANSTTTLTKLAKGSDDEVLTLASGVPSWAAAAGGGLCLQVVGMLKTDDESYRGDWYDKQIIEDFQIRNKMNAFIRNSFVTISNILSKRQRNEPCSFIRLLLA